MNFCGILVGAATFLIIGLCHPLVIKSEYCWGIRSWILFLVAGIAFSVMSILAKDTTISTILGACAFSFFWGIKEVFDQEKRVLKRWFPENPKRSAYYQQKRRQKGL